jgi:hypothetical protein
MANEKNLIPFVPGESGNPNGRPRKSFASINAELKLKGIIPLSKTDLIDAYALVFNTDEDELKAIAADKKTPYALRIIIFELNNSKTRAKAMQDYRDYTFGRAKESLDLNVYEQPLFPDITKPKN